MGRGVRALLDDLEIFHAWSSSASALCLWCCSALDGWLDRDRLHAGRPLKPDALVLSGPAIVPILDPNDRTIDPTRLSKDPASGTPTSATL